MVDAQARARGRKLEFCGGYRATGVVVMKKLLFLDYRELEYVEGFGRAVESPVKDAGAPLLRPDLPWEHGNMQMFRERAAGGGWAVPGLV